MLALRELPWHRVILLAGLLVGMTLFRRWYSFFVVAFFLVAGVLFVLGGLAGFFAAKLLKSGAPPVPAMAIDEANKTKRAFR